MGMTEDNINVQKLGNSTRTSSCANAAEIREPGGAPIAVGATTMSLCITTVRNPTMARAVAQDLGTIPLVPGLTSSLTREPLGAT